MGIRKLLFIVCAFATSAGLVFWLIQQGARSQPAFFPIGIGNPREGMIDLHVAVGMLIPAQDPPKLRNDVVDWDGWVSSHFELVDAAGKRVELRRLNVSKLIPDPIAGVPEFFLAGSLKPRDHYMLTFTPVVGEPRQFRYEFDAPESPTEGETVAFVRLDS